MIELTFLTGGDLVRFKIIDKKIFMLGKPTNYQFVEWNPLGMSADRISLLRAKKGEAWYTKYIEDEEKVRNMNDEEMANDLIQDFEKRGLKLVKRI